MSYKHLLVEVDDRFIGHITLNRPDQLNTFNTQLAADLYQALNAMDNDPGVRVVLLKGAVPGSKGGHVVVRPAVKGGA